MENNYSILFMILLPVVAGIAAFYIGKRNKKVRNIVAGMVVMAELLLLAYFGNFVTGKNAAISLTFGQHSGIRCLFGLDSVRLLFGVMITIIFGVVMQFMQESMKQEDRSNRFYLFYMCAYGMGLGTIMSGGLSGYLLFLILALLCTYPLIVHRQSKMAMVSAKIYMLLLIGMVMLGTIGLILVRKGLGSSSYEDMYTFVMTDGRNVTVLVGGLLVFAGLAVVSGMFPVQYLVTRGASYGLMEASVVLSCVVSKLGIWGMIILAANLFMDHTVYGNILLAGGLLTVIWGLLISFSATDIRKILMGLNVITNGFQVLGIGVAEQGGSLNGYAIRGSIYMMVVSSLSLLVFYMVSLVLVREIHTYQIKGLIASGKGNIRLMLAAFFAAANLCGIPGTLGFCSFSLMFKAIWNDIGWKWRGTLFIILWAAWITAVVRVFMKLFISKKEEALHILTPEQEKTEEVEWFGVPGEDSYSLGETMLVLIGVMQVVVGVFPEAVLERTSLAIMNFLHETERICQVDYFTKDVLTGLGIAAVLAVILYVNLVHGVVLRAVRNKKNRELQRNCERE